VKTLILLVAMTTAVTTIARGQNAKEHLRDFTPKYTIDTFQINGEASYLKRRVILFQKAEGIISAYWDDDSNVLTVQYNGRLVQPPAIKNFFSNNQPIIHTSLKTN
jgi:hypothetical protein